MYYKKSGVTVLCGLMCTVVSLSARFNALITLKNAQGKNVCIISADLSQSEQHLKQLEDFFDTVPPVGPLSFFIYPRYSDLLIPCENTDFISACKNVAQHYPPACLTVYSFSANVVMDAFKRMIFFETRRSLKDTLKLVTTPYKITKSAYCWTLDDLKTAITDDFNTFAATLEPLSTSYPALHRNLTSLLHQMRALLNKANTILYNDLCCHDETCLSSLALAGYIEYLKQRAAVTQPYLVNKLEEIHQKVPSITTQQDYIAVHQELKPYSQLLLSLSYNYQVDEHYRTLVTILSQLQSSLWYYTLLAQLVLDTSPLPNLICVDEKSLNQLIYFLTNKAGYSLETRVTLDEQADNNFHTLLCNYMRPFFRQNLSSFLVNLEDTPFNTDIARLVAEYTYS